MMTDKKVNYNVILSVQPLATMSLDELRTVEKSYLYQGQRDFHDLVTIAMALGGDIQFPLRHNEFNRLFNDINISLLFSKRVEKYDPGVCDWVYRMSVLVTVGKPLAFSDAGEPFIRETTVCRLTCLEISGERKAVDILSEDAFYRPGEWSNTLFSRLNYAHEITNSKRELKQEQERLALASKLLAGRVV